MAIQDDVLAIVKSRLGYDDGSRDGLIMTYVEEVSFRILHYCNLKEIPLALKYVWASIVQHLVFHVQGGYDGNQNGAVTQIKIGDTQTNESQVNKIISPSVSNAMIDKVILNFAVDLNRYRKMVW